MKLKWLMYAGIVFLLSGIILKNTGGIGNSALALIVAGAVLKLSYFVMLIHHKIYKPGLELLLLISGLAIMLSGLKVNGIPNNLATALIIFGISLKVIFVVIFILKVRKTQMGLKEKGAS